MLEVTSLADHGLVKKLFWRAPENISKDTDDLWAEVLHRSCASSLNETATTSHPGKEIPCGSWHGHVPAFTLRPFLFSGMFLFKREWKS